MNKTFFQFQLPWFHSQGTSQGTVIPVNNHVLHKLSCHVEETKQIHTSDFTFYNVRGNA